VMGGETRLMLGNFSVRGFLPALRGLFFKRFASLYSEELVAHLHLAWVGSCIASLCV